MWERNVPTAQNARGEQAVEQKRRKRQSGLSLVEMMAVVTIMSIVAGVGYVVVNNQIEKSRDSTDKANVRTIVDAVNRYIMDKGKSPVDSTANPMTLNDSDAKLLGQYIGAAPKNPWPEESNQYYTISYDATKGEITVTSPHDPNGNADPAPYSLKIKYK